jgi:hypothetical protein
MTGLRHVRCLLLVVFAAGLRAEDKPAGEPARPDNWLVDAMTQPTEGSGGESKGVRASNATGAPKNLGSPGGPEDGTVNPLSNYLAAWMTPRDLELLKARDAATNPAGSAATPGRTAGAPSVTPATQRVNPYLPAPSSAPKTQLTIAPVVPAPKPPTALSPPSKTEDAPAKTTGPPAERQKAQDDAKYFPQLKRF